MVDGPIFRDRLRHVHPKTHHAPPSVIFGTQHVMQKGKKRGRGQARDPNPIGRKRLKSGVTRSTREHAMTLTRRLNDGKNYRLKF